MDTKRFVLPTMLLLLASAQPSLAEPESVPTNPVLGRWMTEKGDAFIKISMDSEGRLVGLGAPGGDDPNRMDEKNPDPKLRGRPLLGARILWGFRPENPDLQKWTDGKIYDPNNGKTYDCKIEFKNNELHIRGYVGIPLFGRTTVWRRPS